MPGVSAPAPHDILGVAVDAGPDEVKAAYRRLVKAVHPDAGGNAALFTQVRDAYEQMTAPGYAPPTTADTGPQPPQPAPAASHDAHRYTRMRDTYQQSMGQQPWARRPYTPRPGAAAPAPPRIRPPRRRLGAVQVAVAYGLTLAAVAGGLGTQLSGVTESVVQPVPGQRIVGGSYHTAITDNAVALLGGANLVAILIAAVLAGAVLVARMRWRPMLVPELVAWVGGVWLVAGFGQFALAGGRLVWLPVAAAVYLGAVAALWRRDQTLRVRWLRAAARRCGVLSAP